MKHIVFWLVIATILLAFGLTGNPAWGFLGFFALTGFFTVVFGVIIFRLLALLVRKIREI